MLGRPELRLSLAVILGAGLLAACSEGAESARPAGGGGSGSGGRGGSGGGSERVGSGLNQCGVAAPLPAETGQCAVVTTPALVDFDDFAGGNAASYTFPVGDARGAVLHVDDGSAAGGSSVVATEMVPGTNGGGHALRISNTNSLNWGGLLMLYLQGDGVTTPCLDARRYGGIELSVKGTAPSGRFGVNVSLLDTTPAADGGLCTNATASDCKDATTSFSLPSDPEVWTTVRVPWSEFTPGVGSDTACVPNVGQNVVRLVIQPFMSYPPPDYQFQPGAYSLTVDDLRFYGAPAESTVPAPGGGSCDLPQTLRFTSGSAPLIAPPSDATHDLVAVKDPSIVYFGERYHVYASSVSTAGAYNMVYTSFTDFSEATTAPVYHMDQTPGFDTYVAAPQLFYFTPQNKWYLVYQSGPPMYSTADDPGDPTSWTAPAPFYASTPAIITQNGGGWLDYWVICDDASCHLFFSSNQGLWYRSKTARADFPRGFGEPEVVLRDSNSGRVFEASNVYKLAGSNRYLALIEAFDQTSNNKRYFRSWLAESLDGPWVPWQASGSFPFASARNVTFDGSPWTNDISHGELVRAGHDETLTLDPCNLRFLIQGVDPAADSGGDYNKIPWHLGLLTQAP